MNRRGMRPERAWISAVRTIAAAIGRPSGAPEGEMTAREAVEAGHSWWLDCPRCRCSGKVDLRTLVATGRGGIGPDTMRCHNCKHGDVVIRVTAAGK